MKARALLGAAIVVFAVASMASAAPLLEEYFEGTGTGWTQGPNSSWTTTVFPGSNTTNAFIMPKGKTSKMWKQFDPRLAKKITIDFDMYSASSGVQTTRNVIGTTGAAGSNATPATVQMAVDTTWNTYRVRYWTTTWQYVDTTVPIIPGWHKGQMVIDVTPTGSTVSWKMDIGQASEKSGSFANASLKSVPIYACVGYGSSNANFDQGADNLVITPEPATLAMLASGLLLLGRRRKA